MPLCKTTAIAQMYTVAGYGQDTSITHQELSYRTLLNVRSPGSIPL